MTDNLFGQKAFTLIELMVAMAIAGIISAAIYSVYISQVRTQIAQEVAIELQQGLRGAISIMTQEIRTAGADPLGDANAGIVTASEEEFHFTRDIVGDPDTGQYDGEINHDEEDIRYVLDGEQLQRWTGGSSPPDQPGIILDNVEILEFLYWVYSNDDDELRIMNSEDEPDDIRRIDVTIVARSSQSDRGLLRRHTDTREYRNQDGDVILKPVDYDESARRMKLSTTIKRRNLRN